MIVSGNGIGKSFGGEVVLKEVQFEIQETDRIGLVGMNGAGKSTLLNILTGNLEQDIGQIQTKKGLNIGYLKQTNFLELDNTLEEEIKSVFKEILELQEKITQVQEDLKHTKSEDEKMITLMRKYESLQSSFEAKSGYEITYKIQNVLNGLGFQNYDMTMPVKNLSGGEKIRFAMAKILLQNPELLILDEPTNHLDFIMLEWLENYLQSYKGAIVVVSHDRYFLDKIINKVWEIKNTQLTKYVGNYTNFVEQKHQKLMLAQKEYEKQQEEIEKLTEFVHKNLAKSSSVNGVGTRVKALEKMERLEKPSLYEKELKIKFEIDSHPYLNVLQLFHVGIEVGKEKTKLYENVNFEIERGQKVAIIGPNGIGKTSLLKAMLGKIEYLGRIKWGENTRISYFDQEGTSLHMENTAIEEIHQQFPQKTDLEIRNLFANLLLTEDTVFKKIKELSGANRAKVVLAKIIFEKPNVLILDEPTNHFDYLAKEALTEALKKFEGTIILVSHDRYLLNTITTKIIELGKEGIQTYLGNYENYVIEKRNRMDISNVKKVEEKVTKSKEKNILLQKNKKRMASIEKKMQQLEEKIKKTQEEMLLPEHTSNYIELSRMGKEVDIQNEELNVLLEEWVMLTETIEKENQ